jgi:hypothetical protein
MAGCCVPRAAGSGRDGPGGGAPRRRGGTDQGLTETRRANAAPRAAGWSRAAGRGRLSSVPRTPAVPRSMNTLPRPVLIPCCTGEASSRVAARPSAAYAPRKTARKTTYGQPWSRPARKRCSTSGTSTTAHGDADATAPAAYAGSRGIRRRGGGVRPPTDSWGSLLGTAML